MKRKVTIAVVVVVLIFIVVMATNKVLSLGKDDDINNQVISLDDKLKVLGNIDTKIKYFKNDYINRYLAYKKKNPNLTNERIVLEVNIGLDQEFYTNVKKSSHLNTPYILVNKFYYLDQDYVPDKLEVIDTKYSLGEKYLVNIARISFEALAKKASEEGYTIRAISTYRSYDYQTTLYNNYVKSDGVEEADTYSARPGFSEHQTGLTLDIDNVSSNYMQFESTKEFTWMQNNAHKYGFILRYPKGKENITGYTYEAWHYRYVGVVVATFIHNNQLTYEEYYAKYVENQ